MNAVSDDTTQRDRFAWVPSPLAIALGLTAVTAVAACVVGADVETVATSWRDGLWNRPLLVFAFQAAFMLVLGHALALSPAVDRGVQRAVAPAYLDVVLSRLRDLQLHESAKGGRCHRQALTEFAIPEEGSQLVVAPLPEDNLRFELGE